MAKQLSLMGFEDAQPTDRLFFAIFPDANSAARIARLAEGLRDSHGLRGKPLASNRFHITLHHLGDHIGLPQSIVAAACEAAANVTMPQFDVAFDRAGGFARGTGNRPFVLQGGDGLAALALFQRVLGTAMMKAGLKRWTETSFTPHVTLLYDDQDVARHSVETIGWTVKEFVLVQSLLGQTRHIPLARWQLRG
jgi:RNA 2',3'-cyclic 3'-phosphodiesterase